MRPLTEPPAVPSRIRAALWASFTREQAAPRLHRAEAPLDLRGPFRLRRDPGLFFLRNATAGLFPGDEIDLRFRACPGTATTVSSPSADKIHAGQGSAARTRLQLEAEPGSRLRFLPQPTILQAGARLDQSVHLICHQDAELVYADIIVLGRLAMGERLDFGRLDSHLQLARPAGPAQFEERFWLSPAEDAAALETALDGAGAIVSVIHAGRPNAGDARERLAATVEGWTDGYAGVDQLPHDAGIIVRGLAADARAAAELVRRAVE